jgi:hypothetical protein
MPIITALQQHKLNTVAHGIQIIELGLRHLSYAGISCRSPSAAASWWHNAGYIHETDWRHWDTLDPPSCCPPRLDATLCRRQKPKKRDNRYCKRPINCFLGAKVGSE